MTNTEIAELVTFVASYIIGVLFGAVALFVGAIGVLNLAGY